MARVFSVLRSVFSKSNHSLILTFHTFQGRVWTGLAAERPHSHRRPAPGSALRRQGLSDRSAARILAQPQDYLLWRGERWVHQAGPEARNHSPSFKFSDLDQLNERMPPRKDASEGNSPVDGPRQNSTNMSWVSKVKNICKACQLFPHVTINFVAESGSHCIKRCERWTQWNFIRWTFLPVVNFTMTRIFAPSRRASQRHLVTDRVIQAAHRFCPIHEIHVEKISRTID